MRILCTSPTMPVPRAMPTANHHLHPAKIPATRVRHPGATHRGGDLHQAEARQQERGHPGGVHRANHQGDPRKPAGHRAAILRHLHPQGQLHPTGLLQQQR
ncbi:hypothetical protein LSTR_LSTR014923 [Laodelphax striatellus]|uniref:Uncharacterized protein n=1 Tax=Laodelphax striatellus TaxID=195883 RepID=A0A482X0V4_LAOST|nr:hypothetical protein LSTR_LSTR014923 [Laodelphax striatellus]